MGKATHLRLAANAWKGSTLLNCIYGQLYNGKLANRYGHAPTDECPLCHKPYSCTYISGYCHYHKPLTCSCHYAACQLVHATIRISAKSGGGLHRAPDLVHVTADAGSHPHTSQVSLENLCPKQCTQETVANGTLHYSLPAEERVADRAPFANMEWLDALPTTEATRIRRNTDVSQDPRYVLQGPFALDYDAECTAASSRMPPWVLPAEETQALLEEATAQLRTSYTLEESRSRPTPARPTSTKRHAPSSS